MSQLNVQMQRKLYIKPYDRMVKDIVNEISDESIILDPDYQRKYIWSSKRASLLVESILLNIPIPVIYASESNDNKWIIVDGLQRLYSLKRFYNNEIKLNGLETLKELNGLKYNALGDEIQKKLDRGELRIILLLKESDPNIQYDIFMRLNTGAVKLNEQELRNCLFRGSLNDCIKKMSATNEELKKLIPVKTDRMVVNELLLRYLAISASFDKGTNMMVNYDGRIKNLINSYMHDHQNDDEEHLRIIQTQIENQATKAYAVLGTDAFKKNDKTTKINSGLYECIMLGFEDYPLESLIKKQSNIVALVKTLLNDELFVQSIDKATGNTTVMNYRLSTFRRELRRIMNNASEN